jgi:hypothetical protein
LLIIEIEDANTQFALQILLESSPFLQRVDLDEILKGHPKGTILGIDKLDLFGDFRMFLP